MSQVDISLVDKDHAVRVSMLAREMAKHMGFKEPQLSFIGTAALLHDVGKARVPSDILDKPGKLTDEEFAVVREHCRYGFDIIARLSKKKVPWLSPEARSMAAQVALEHHERLDGSGYYGLNGAMISLPARIVAVADVYDALTHDRPYRGAWAEEDSLSWIKERSTGVAGCSMFDVHAVRALETAVNRSGIRTDALAASGNR